MPFTFFFFNDTATTEIYTLSLHDALPIYALAGEGLELHALLALEAGQGFGQADHSDLYQIIKLHIGRQLGDHVQRDPAYQRYMPTDQCIAVELAFGGVHGSQWLPAWDAGSGAKPAARSWPPCGNTLPA